ncbi:MAG: hypothetical protein CVU36_08635 [Betaproteobacteria bacterium HGW-Betaproteobacteria-9]|jgi:hypothetical protein|nr:MAG: hypothetical protein CVU36_08635 [Betaproteobacteria bacterium HGW-Betaproteobacteria-9]
MNTPNQQSKVLNLTPALVDTKSAVLIVNPDATLSQRASLAWTMAYENLNILEASQSAHGDDLGNDKAMLCVAIERMHQLTTLLADVHERTSALERGAA